MPDVRSHLARALIEKHGNNALAVAERALAKAAAKGLKAIAAEWEMVIATIRAIQSRPPPDTQSGGTSS